jgi:TonB-dependent receptor
MLLNLYYENKSRLIPLVLLAFLLVFQSFTSAQTGTIKGTVTDKTTKDALIGANILVQGTNQGAAADLDGNYTIHNVSAGSHVLAVSYIGYKSLTVNVNVVANKTNEVNIKLEAVAIEGKTVVVTAQARGQLQAINQQLSSSNIVNVVSAEKMQELPDANIAESIGRLPGISIQRDAGEADKVVVRGLSPQFNEVTIEGIPMSSTNFSSISSVTGSGQQNQAVSFSQDRSIDLSLLSDNLVQGVEVSKTLRPDMDPNALGGTINLTLRTAQPGLHYSIGGNGGYNHLRNSYNNYKLIGSISDRFLDDKIGAIILGNIEEKQLPSDQFLATYASPTYQSTTNQFYVNTQSAQLTDNNTKRQRFGVSVILDYTSDFVDVKFFNVYTSKIDSTITRVFNSNFSSNRFENDYFIYKTRTEQRTNSIQALFRIAGTELPVSLSYTKGNQSTPNAQSFQFLQSGLPAISASAVIYGQPLDLIHTQGTFNANDPNSTFFNMAINNTSVNDDQYDAKIDWKVPFKVSDFLSGKLSVGGKYHTLMRTSSGSQIFDQILFGQGAGNRLDLVNSIPYLNGINPNGGANAGQAGLPAYPWLDPSYGRSSILGYPIGNSFDVYKLSAMQNYYAFGLNKVQIYFQSGPNDYNQNYNDKEITSAGYLMGEFNIGSDLSVVAGARWQQVQSQISAYHIAINLTNQNGLQGIPNLVESRSTHPDWFPSINAKYKLNENVQLVGAIYKSVSLPDFFQISPLVVLQQNNQIVSGNPLLKPSTAWNMELGASVFSNNIGLFTVNGFYKDISNLIYGMANYYPFSTYPMRGAPSDIASRLPGRAYYDTNWAAQNHGATLQTNLIPMNNPDDAFLRGVELSWQTHLWYLPGVLSGIVLDLNASWMSSSQMYPSFKVVGPVVGNKDTLVYTTVKGSLQNQPKAIYNAILGWDYKGFSARFSLSYQQVTLTSIDTRYGLEDFYYDNVTLLDISLKQQIIDNFAVYGNVTNINNHIDNNYFAHPAYNSGTKIYPGGQLPQSGQTYSWNAQLGISFSY